MNGYEMNSDKIKKLLLLNAAGAIMIFTVSILFAFDYGGGYIRKPIIPVMGVGIGLFLIYGRSILAGSALGAVAYYSVVFFSGYFIESIEQINFIESIMFMIMNATFFIAMIRFMKVNEQIIDNSKMLFRFLFICFLAFCISNVIKIEILGYNLNESILNSMAYMNGNIICSGLIVSYYKNRNSYKSAGELLRFVLSGLVLYFITTTEFFDHSLLREMNLYMILFFFIWAVFNFGLEEIMGYLGWFGIMASFDVSKRVSIFYRLELQQNAYELQLLISFIAVMVFLLKVINNEKEASLISLENAENHFVSYFKLGISGISIVNTSGRFIKVNEKLCDMLGYDSEELLEKNISDVTVREDIPETIRMKNMLLSGDIDYYEIKKRYIKKNGEIIYVLLGVSGIRDFRGRIVYLAGAVSDITKIEMQSQELNRLNENLEDLVKKRTDQLKTAYEDLKDEISRRELAQAQAVRNIKILDSGIESLTSGIAVVELENFRFVMINSAALQMMKKSKPQVVGKGYYEMDLGFELYINGKEKLEAKNSPFRKAFKEGDKINNLELLAKFKDGSRRWILLNASPIEDSNGNISSIIVVFNDITQRKETERILIENHKKLTIYADYDDMTGALNRRKGLEVIEAKMAEGKRMSIVFIDLDNLKVVNDRFGHVEGDFFIRTVSRVAKSHLGKNDTMIRLGGDEFLLVFEGMQKDKLELMMKAIEIELQRKSRELKKSYRISISWGIAEYSDQASIQDFIREADGEMYKNKNFNKEF